jgi:hypothetical protein
MSPSLIETLIDNRRLTFIGSYWGSCEGQINHYIQVTIQYSHFQVNHTSAFMSCDLTGIKSNGKNIYIGEQNTLYMQCIVRDTPPQLLTSAISPTNPHLHIRS